ncbi:MAG: PEGA domain-containing protein [Myxococcota bacterium]
MPFSDRRVDPSRAVPALLALALAWPGAGLDARAASETHTQIDANEAAPKAGQSGKKKSGKKKSNNKKSGKKKSGKKKSNNKKSGKKKSSNQSNENESDEAAPEPSDDNTVSDANTEETLEALKESAPPLLPTTTKKEPEPEPGVKVVTPIRVRGSLSRSSRGTLVKRLEAALAAAAWPDEPLQARLRVNASRKRRFGITLTISDLEGSTRAEVADACESCSVDDAAALVEGLVGKVAAQLRPPEPVAGPATITVRSDPKGASLRVDGTQHGATPQTVELSPGDHELVLAKPGFTELRQALTVAADEQRELDLKLVPTATDDGPKAGRGWTIGGAIALGLGVAGAATGAALILIDESAPPLECSPDQVDFRGICRHRYDTLLGGIIGAAAGGAGIATGVGLLIKGHLVSVKARGNAESASMSVTLRF